MRKSCQTSFWIYFVILICFTACSKIDIGDNWGYIGSGDGSGNSESSVTVEVPEGYACPSSVDSSSNNWASDTWYQYSTETFAITQNGTQITIVRTDQDPDWTGGWKTELAIYCCPEGNDLFIFNF